MKKLTCCWVVLFLLFFNNTKAQMGFIPSDLSINSPQNINVYKKYTEGKTFLGFNLGAAIPFGSYDFFNSDINSVGMGAGIQARYFINDHFAFGASFNFYSSGFQAAHKSYLDTLFMVATMNDTTGLQVVSIDGSSTLYPFTVNLEYFLSPLNRFKPYFGLGLGFYVVNYSVEVVTNKEKPKSFREVEALNGSNIDGNFGLCPYFGFMLDFNELMSLNFDLKYNQIFSSPVSSALSFNLGIIFNMGYKY
jgi:outer membrane protein W